MESHNTKHFPEYKTPLFFCVDDLPELVIALIEMNNRSIPNDGQITMKELDAVHALSTAITRVRVRKKYAQPVLAGRIIGLFSGSAFSLIPTCG